MDEKYIEQLYNHLGGQSKFGAYNDFKDLISTNPDYRRQFHQAIGEQQLGAYGDFEALVAKKKDSSEDSGPSVPASTPPAAEPTSPSAGVNSFDEQAKASKAKAQDFEGRVKAFYDPVDNEYFQPLGETNLHNYNEKFAARKPQKDFSYGDIVDVSKVAIKDHPSYSPTGFLELQNHGGKGVWTPVEKPQEDFLAKNLEPVVIQAAAAYGHVPKEQVDQYYQKKGDKELNEYLDLGEQFDGAQHLKAFGLKHPEVIESLQHNLKENGAQKGTSEGRVALLEKSISDAYDLNKPTFDAIQNPNLDTYAFQDNLKKLQESGYTDKVPALVKAQKDLGHRMDVISEGVKKNPALEGKYNALAAEYNANGKKLQALQEQVNPLLQFFEQPENKATLERLQKQFKGNELLQSSYQFFPEYRNRMNAIEDRQNASGDGLSLFKSFSNSFIQGITGTGNLIGALTNSDTLTAFFDRMQQNADVDLTTPHRATEIAGKYNFGNDLKNMGDEIASIAGYLLPETGLAKAGVSAKVATGLWIGTSAFGQSYRQGISQGMNNAEAGLYGAVVGYLNKAAFELLPKPELATDFKPSAEVIAGMLNPKTRVTATRELVSDYMKTIARNGLKEYGTDLTHGVAGQELLKLGTALTNGFFNEATGTHLSTETGTLADFVQSVKTMGLFTAGMKGAGFASGVRDIKTEAYRNELLKKAAGGDYGFALSVLDNLRGQEGADPKAIDALEATINKMAGLRFPKGTEPEQKVALVNTIDQIDKLNAQKASADPEFQGPVDKQIKELEKQKEEILTNPEAAKAQVEMQTAPAQVEMQEAAQGAPTEQGAPAKEAPASAPNTAAPSKDTPTEQGFDQGINNTPGRIQVAAITGGKVKPLHKIIFDASSKLKTRIIYGKSKGAPSSTYSPSNKGIKIAYEGNLDHTAHEIGHALDDQFHLLTEAKNDPAAAAELDQFSQHGSTPQKGHPNPQAYKDAEGIAEFIRAHVVNPDAARQAAPNLQRVFEQVVPKDARASLKTFSDDVRTWAGASGHDKIMANTEWEPEKKNPILDLFKKGESSGNFQIGFWDRVQSNVTDSLHAFVAAFDYLKGIKGVTEVTTSKDPILLARLFADVGGKAFEFLSHGVRNSRGDILKSSTGDPITLNWMMEPLDRSSEKTLQQELKQAGSYMIAERTEELQQKDIERQITEAHAAGRPVDDALIQSLPRYQRFDADNKALLQKGVKLQKITPREVGLTGIGAGIESDIQTATQHLAEFAQLPADKQARIKESATRYREFADAMLQYMVDKGRMSNETYNEIKQSNLQYVALHRIGEAEPGQELALFQGSGSSKTIGTKSEVIKKIKGSSMRIQNPYTSLLGTFFKAIQEADRNEIMLAFRDALHDPRQMHQGDGTRYADIGVVVDDATKETIPIFVNGKVENWRFNQDIYKALKAMEGDVYNFPQLAKMPATIVRWTVTHFPTFAARNWVRDFQDRIIKSNEHTIIGGFKNIFGEGEDWRTIASVGGLNSGYYLKSREAYYGLLKESMIDLTKKGHIIADGDHLKNLWHKYEHLLYASETSNRVAEYRSAFDKAKAKGMADYEASLYAAGKARELLDFAVGGHWVRVINQIIPFTNAAVQGLRSSVMKFKENPAGFMTRTALFSVLPEAAIWALNHRDKDDNSYEDLPAYQRDMYYNFKLGPNKWLSVPKPYELSLAAAGFSRLFSYNQGNKDAFKGFDATVLRAFMPLDETAVAGPFKTVSELQANYDSFRDKSIVPPHEEALNLALRHTETASRLGQVIQKVAGVDARKADYFIRSQFSYFGNAAIKASNIGASGAREHFDITDLGFFKHSPVYNSAPVQELVQYSKEWQLNQTHPMKYFNAMAQEYFAAETDQQKEILGKELVHTAKEILKQWKAGGIDQLKVAKKQAKDTK